MKELVARALNVAEIRKVNYADIRIVSRQMQSITVKNGIVEGVSWDESDGFGIRVLKNGAWGFASSFKLEKDEIDRIASMAIKIAESSSMVKKEDIEIGEPCKIIDNYKTHREIDPFKIPLEEKINIMMMTDNAARKVKGVNVSTCGMEFIREKKLFSSTEGSLIEQEIMKSGGGLEVLASAEREVQKRSYPNSFGRHMATGGWEVIKEMYLIENAERIGEEVVALLSAKPCPSVITDVIIDGTQMALQVHESCGHPIELDRVFGMEASYAGTSFLTPEKLGNYRYGSEIVNITADAKLPGGLGSYGYDDEGILAMRVPIVRNGIFVGYLTSRETAIKLGQKSNGTMRADGFNRIPLIRMTNINLEPGEWSLEDLVADTKEGLYLETNKSWSIDDKRLNFQFGVELAREIKNGKLGDLVKNATYTGITPEFWNSCDGICNKKYWRMWGTPNCGKGQPAQTAHVGHGTAPARFRNVRVGIIK